MAKVKNKNQNGFKYFIGLVLVLLFRLIPFRIPNVEPVMGTIMPFSKKFSKISSFLFGALSIIIYDFITQKVGVWTWVTAGMYGLVGLAASYYLANKARNKIRHYVAYSIVATIVYDAVTGIGIGMLFFNQTFMVTSLGQIPFTLMHLGGNIAFAAILSPVVYKWVTDNKHLETNAVVQRVRNVFAA